MFHSPLQPIWFVFGVVPPKPRFFGGVFVLFRRRRGGLFFPATTPITSTLTNLAFAFRLVVRPFRRRPKLTLHVFHKMIYAYILGMAWRFHKKGDETRLSPLSAVQVVVHSFSSLKTAGSRHIRLRACLAFRHPKKLKTRVRKKTSTPQVQLL